MAALPEMDVASPLQFVFNAAAGSNAARVKREVIESAKDAHSSLSSLPSSTDMKPSSRLAYLLIARMKRNLHLLNEALRPWAPKQAPALVPIPIRSENRTRWSDRRHPTRCD
jgi:hypothetical protein